MGFYFQSNNAVLKSLKKINIGPSEGEEIVPTSDRPTNILFYIFTLVLGCYGRNIEGLGLSFTRILPYFTQRSYIHIGVCLFAMQWMVAS